MAISYFPGLPDVGSAAHYTRGFKVADTNDVARLAQGLAHLVWSPCVWLEGHRRQDNFEFADWCVLDFDSGEMTLKDAVNDFCDMVHVIGTTKSHRVAKGGGPPVDRFRVALRFDERVDNLRLYRWNMWRLTEVFPADPACKDGARFFYPCVEIVSMSADGYTQELHKEIPPSFDRPAATVRSINAGMVPKWVQRELDQVIPIGERNTTLYKIAKDLRRCGFEPGTILHMVLRSTTYRETLASPKLLTEMQQTIASACRNIALEGGPIVRPDSSP